MARALAGRAEAAAGPCRAAAGGLPSRPAVGGRDRPKPAHARGRAAARGWRARLPSAGRGAGLALLGLALVLLLAQSLGRLHGAAHGLPIGLQAAARWAAPLAPAAPAPDARAGHPPQAHGHPHPAADHAADHAAGSVLCELIDDLAQAPLDLPALPGLAAGPVAEACPAAPRPAPRQAEAPARRARDPPALA